MTLKERIEEKRDKIDEIYEKFVECKQPAFVLKGDQPMIPSEQEIREAIVIAEKMIKFYDERGGGHHQKEALKLLIKTNQSILSASGIVEKKNNDKGLYKSLWVNGFNDCHSQFTLAITKKRLLTPEG